MMTVMGTPSSHSKIGIVFLLIIKLAIEKLSQPIREKRNAPETFSWARGSSC